MLPTLFWKISELLMVVEVLNLAMNPGLPCAKLKELRNSSTAKFFVI
jgi:hypothetical protein